MIPLSKIHEGCEVRLWMPSGNNGQGHIRSSYIDTVYEDIGMYDYRIILDGYPTIDRIGGSVYSDPLELFYVLNVVRRYDKPVQLWTEIKTAIVMVIHGAMTRWGFDFK